MEDNNVIDEYNMRKEAQKISKFMGILKEEIGGGKKKPIKTFPIKKEWEDLHTECMEMAKNIAQQSALMQSKRNLLWSTIENELKEYGPKTYNAKTNQIDVFEDGVEGKTAVELQELLEGNDD